MSFESATEIFAKHFHWRAHSVQQCLYAALLYAEGEDAVMYAEAVHVVATLMEEVLEKLDTVSIRNVAAADREFSRS